MKGVSTHWTVSSLATRNRILKVLATLCPELMWTVTARTTHRCKLGRRRGECIGARDEAGVLPKRKDEAVTVPAPAASDGQGAQDPGFQHRHRAGRTARPRARWAHYLVEETSRLPTGRRGQDRGALTQVSGEKRRKASSGIR